MPGRGWVIKRGDLIFRVVKVYKRASDAKKAAVKKGLQFTAHGGRFLLIQETGNK